MLCTTCIRHRIWLQGIQLSLNQMLNFLIPLKLYIRTWCNNRSSFIMIDTSKQELTLCMSRRYIYVLPVPCAQPLYMHLEHIKELYVLGCRKIFARNAEGYRFLLYVLSWVLLQPVVSAFFSADKRIHCVL